MMTITLTQQPRRSLTLRSERPDAAVSAEPYLPIGASKCGAESVERRRVGGASMERSSFGYLL